MAWAFGLKAKTVNDDKKKSQDGSQTDIDRLQGYHELAKVNIATSASVRYVSVRQMGMCLHRTRSIELSGLTSQGKRQKLSSFITWQSMRFMKASA